MELWIRSQDRTKLVKSNYLSLFLSDTNWFIYTDTEIGEPFRIGKYKTKERALEVLDEIHQRLINLQCIEVMGIGNITNQMKRNGIDCVYEMPKE